MKRNHLTRRSIIGCISCLMNTETMLMELPGKYEYPDMDKLLEQLEIRVCEIQDLVELYYTGDKSLVDLPKRGKDD